MTLGKLKELVDHAIRDGRNADLEVCIPNNRTGTMGSIPTTKVSYAWQGIDWESGLFIITPEKPMIEKP